tara:strand:+ start:237 stop:578 length:342 start_codon:yes stop_codon:yes gene_type:complete
MKRSLLVFAIVGFSCLVVSSQDTQEMILQPVAVCEDGQCQVRRGLFGNRRVNRSIVRNGDVDVQIDLGGGEFVEKIAAKRQVLKVERVERVERVESRGPVRRLFSRILFRRGR